MLTLTRLLLVIWMTVATLSAVSAIKTSHFLFVGQSNMEGIVENSRDQPRVETTLNLLLSDNDDDVIFQNLLSHFQSFYSNPPTPTEVYELEARELIRYKNEGLMPPDFREPLSSVACSFYQLEFFIDYRRPGQFPIERAIDAALSPYANCGVVYGPELLFGHTMSHQQPSSQQQQQQQQQLSIVKFASGGSELNRHWSQDNGFFWQRLVETVESRTTTTTTTTATTSQQQDDNEWKGIVWFQGENDSFDRRNSEAYFDDLTVFMADLRLVMYEANNNNNADDGGTIFLTPEAIPVVIVGLGCWVMTDLDYGDVVMQAQNDFVANDDHAVLVETQDLSCHFHYDEASQLIIGERVALAVQGLLPEEEEEPVVVVVEPPTPSPVTPPTPSPVTPPITPSPVTPPTPSPVTPPTPSPVTPPQTPSPVPAPPSPPTGPWSYTDPEWWNQIVNDFTDTAHPLRMCSRRQFPPPTGEACSSRTKTCLWGNQVCGDGGLLYPATKCVCRGARWWCDEGPVACGSI